MTRVDLVIPTVGRPSLARCLQALEAAPDFLPRRVILVDDRRRPHDPLPIGALSEALVDRFEILASGHRGPAAARNIGWQVADASWVAFLDEDVVPEPDWAAQLHIDLAGLGADVAGSQGRIVVPLPTAHRPTTDRERGATGLAQAHGTGADIAYRRDVLERLNGFDERFPRAGREDTDLAMRVRAEGHRIVDGARTVHRPVEAVDAWASVRAQASNADDALMRVLHGHGWRTRAAAPAGRLVRHAGITAAAAVALAGALGGQRRLAAAGLLAWLGGTAELAWRRIAPGPRTLAEVATIVAASIAIPPTAVWHRLRGELRAARFVRGARRSARRAVDAVLFDRDGTLVAAVANGDPAAVRPLAGAREAVRQLRAAGVRVAVVTNEDALGDGRIGAADVAALHARIDALVGPFDAWLVCPHAEGDGCTCRKPAPGLVQRALRALDVPSERCAMIGDTGADVAAARAAGVRPILVPNAITRAEEIATAPEVARTLHTAARRLLGTGP